MEIRVSFCLTMLACFVMFGCTTSHQVSRADTDPKQPLDLRAPHLVLTNQVAWQSGRSAAERDIAHDVSVCAGFGSPIWIYKDWQELLLQKYGIKVCWVDVDHADNQTLEYWRGYNDLACSELEQRFGTNFMQQTVLEAFTNYMREAKLQVLRQ
jgi:hypothetical protein